MRRNCDYCAWAKHIGPDDVSCQWRPSVVASGGEYSAPINNSEEIEAMNCATFVMHAPPPTKAEGEA
jgi:hypothetical protein